ncbi:MAG: flagellar hook-associated family protein, partial [Notoacmeibacter sp.]
MQLLPTRLVNSGPIESLARLQSELALRQKELSTGVKADVGLDAGSEIRRNVSLRSSLAEIETFQRLNGVASSRLQGAQTVLTSIAGAADSFLSDGIPARDAPNARFLMGQAASNALSDLTRNLNSEIGGFPVFGGQSLDPQPMKDFSGPDGLAAKAAIDASFSAQFGFLPNDPLAANLSASDLKTYFDGPFATLFDTTQWGSLWSSASSAPMQSEISPGMVSETTSTTHLDGLRELTKGYVALAYFKDTPINDSAYKGLVDSALGSTRIASEGLTSAQASLGLSQERVSNATDRLGDMETVFSRSLNDLEATDSFEVAARINTLLTGIEASYAMTARLQRLSLI